MCFFFPPILFFFCFLHIPLRFFFSSFFCEFVLITPSTTVRIIHGLCRDDNARWGFETTAEKKNMDECSFFRCGSFGGDDDEDVWVKVV